MGLPKGIYSLKGNLMVMKLPHWGNESLILKLVNFLRDFNMTYIIADNTSKLLEAGLWKQLF